MLHTVKLEAVVDQTHQLHLQLPPDTPAGKAKDSINRVKLTAREDGTIDVSLFEMREVDLIGAVDPANVAKTLEAFTGLDFGSAA